MKKADRFISAVHKVNLKTTILILLLILLLIIVICCPHIMPLCIKTELSSMLHPFESDNRPQTLTLFLTLLISVVSAYHTCKQYKILKMRDVLKMHNLINRIQALLNYHIKSLEETVNEDNFELSTIRFNLSSEKRITENDIKMVFELEQLIYEHVIIENDKEDFIKKTTHTMIEIRELIYSLNTLYKLAENDCSMDFLRQLKLNRANDILENIDKYKKSLYQNTSLIKIKKGPIKRNQEKEEQE